MNWASKELGEGDLQRNGYELDKKEGGETVIGLRLEIRKVGGHHGGGVAFYSKGRMWNLPKVDILMWWK